MHFEPKNPRAIPVLVLLRHQRRVHLKQDVRETRPEVGAVDVGVAGRFRVVEVLALGAVELDGSAGGEVREAGREERVGVAEDPGAFAEVGFFVLVELELLVG